MEDKNLENINEIDLSFNGHDDDESFGKIRETKVIPVSANKQENEPLDEGGETVQATVHTGIIIKFDDEDDFDSNMKKHISNQPIEIVDNAQKSIPSQVDTKGYNEIDLECNCIDDTEDGSSASTPNKSEKRKSMFDDDEDLDSKELAIEEDVTDFLPSKKVSVTTIEDDYWKQHSKKYDETTEEDLDEEVTVIEEEKQVTLKNMLKELQNKHSKSIKKGAMGTHFHLAGNPQKGREMFNAGVGKQGDGQVFPGMSMDKAASTLIGGGGIAVDGSTVSSGLSSSGGISAGGISAGGMGGGESFKSVNYGKVLQEVFDTIGFDVTKNTDGTLIAKDLFNETNKINAKNISDLIYALTPFIESCIIIPLSAATNQKFNGYEDWCNWYNDENKQKFPKYANEIKYCDLLANHINECDI